MVNIDSLFSSFTSLFRVINKNCTRPVKFLRGYVGPLLSQKLKIAFSQISFDWFIRRITVVIDFRIYLNFTVAMVTKRVDKIGIKQRSCHFGPNLRLLETDFFKI